MSLFALSTNIFTNALPAFLANPAVFEILSYPKKAILCFAHQYNTFDKRRLLVKPNPNYVKPTNLKPSTFIKNKELLKFYAAI